ncbi:MAG: hypothetical protein AB7F22_29660 [Reyranella sp.]|uniref:hypothetical protein n=1 Tax=Reyranella sp. TaxID=1929291 RepID=UPI003D0B2292
MLAQPPVDPVAPHGDEIAAPCGPFDEADAILAEALHGAAAVDAHQAGLVRALVRDESRELAELGAERRVGVEGGLAALVDRDGPVGQDADADSGDGRTGARRAGNVVGGMISARGGEHQAALRACRAAGSSSRNRPRRRAGVCAAELGK